MGLGGGVACALARVWLGHLLLTWGLRLWLARWFALCLAPWGVRLGLGLRHGLGLRGGVACACARVWHGRLRLAWGMRLWLARWVWLRLRLALWRGWWLWGRSGVGA